MGDNSFIELNGERHNSGNGSIATDENNPIKHKQYAPHHQRRGVIDDFITRSPHPSHSNDQQAASDHGASTPHPHDNRSTHAAHHHHQPQRAQTLMRSAVKKPTPEPLAYKVNTLAGTLPPRPTPNLPSQPTQVNSQHEARSHEVTKSPAISRFKFGRHNETPSFTSTPNTPTNHHVAATTDHQAVNSTVSQPALNQVSRHEVVNRGFEAATSHEQPAPQVEAKTHKKKRKKSVRITRAIFLVVILVAFLGAGGWVSYYKVPGIATRFASLRSGINAQPPSYVPAGYAYKPPIQYAKGIVWINYYSAETNQTYRIAQQNASWDNQDVLSHVITPNNYTYKAYEKDGLTIYVYGLSQATWVNGGMLYTITGTANLDGQQITNIATSIG